jgi:glycosyltransferase involved in cell wall biosynthesis
MKVLYFHQHFSTPDGSTGTRSYEFAKALILKGHEVSMVCGSYSGGVTGLTNDFKAGKRSGKVDGIFVTELQLNYANQHGFIKRSSTFLKYAFRSVWIALREDYDIVFATSTPLTAAIPGIFARWIRRKKFVFEVRDLWPELPVAMGVIKNPVIIFLLDTLETVAYKSAHRLIGLSGGITDGILKKGIPRERVTTISNGCDIDLFAENNEKVIIEGVTQANFVAVYAGTHGLANGLFSVLQTAQVLKARKCTNIKLVLIGDGQTKKELQRFAKKHKLDNVIFVPPLSKQKLVTVLQNSNLGLQILENIPAFYEGTSPNKFFDYIASGLPVLVNYPGWVANLIKTHQAGYVVDAENPDMFARTLIAASEDPHGLVKMSAQARQLGLDEFSRTNLAQKWVEWVCGEE